MGCCRPCLPPTAISDTGSNAGPSLESTVWKAQPWGRLSAGCALPSSS